MIGNIYIRPWCDTLIYSGSFYNSKLYIDNIDIYETSDSDCLNNTTLINENEMDMTENKEVLMAYPNPFSSSITIEIKSDIDDGTIKNGIISIYDIYGRLVKDFTDTYRNSSSNNIFTWQATGYPSGIYLFYVNNG
jgi:hypothetical protein